jgi:hypothetical protein
VLFPSNVYLAGLWMASLEQMLLWEGDPSYNQLPSVYVAPTWSWASITGPIVTRKWWARLDKLLVKVAGITIDTQTHFGSVSGGKLTLQGHLGKALVVEDRNTDRWFLPSRDIVLLDIVFEGSHGIEKSMNRPTVDVLDQTLVSFPVHCLPAMKHKDSVQGLLLERVGGPEGPYRRVGVFDCEARFFMSEKGEWVDQCCESEVYHYLRTVQACYTNGSY